MVFISPLKALFVLKIFKLLFLDFLVMCKSGLIRKIGWFQNLWRHNLVNKQLQLGISRSKDNQTMKFAQLVEYNTRNLFDEKSYTKCGGETIPRSISKKSKLSLSLDQNSLKVLYSLFLLYANLKAIKL